MIQHWLEFGLSEAARILGMNPKAAGFLSRREKISAIKIANRWLIPKAFVEELAKTYVPRRGRPKRKTEEGKE